MTKKIFNFNVPVKHDKERIDRFLQLQFEKTSRTKLQSLIRDGHVNLNSSIIRETA